MAGHRLLRPLKLKIRGQSVFDSPVLANRNRKFAFDNAGYESDHFFFRAMCLETVHFPSVTPHFECLDWPSPIVQPFDSLSIHRTLCPNHFAVDSFHSAAQLRARVRGCFLSTWIVCVITLLTSPEASVVWTFTVRVGVFNPLPEVENVTALNTA